VAFRLRRGAGLGGGDGRTGRAVGAAGGAGGAGGAGVTAGASAIGHEPRVSRNSFLAALTYRGALWAQSAT